MDLSLIMFSNLNISMALLRLSYDDASYPHSDQCNSVNTIVFKCFRHAFPPSLCFCSILTFTYKSLVFFGA